MLTISLITMNLLFPSSTTSAALYFRTVPILPEGSGRVAKSMSTSARRLKKGDVLFRLDNSKQQAALETTNEKIAEVDASLIAGAGRRHQDRSQIGEAKASYQQARTNWIPKASCSAAIPASCAARHREAAGAGRPAAVRCRCRDGLQGVAVIRVSTLLPAERRVPRPSRRRRRSNSTKPLFVPRRRARRAVPGSHRRRRQSTDAARRRVDTEGAGRRSLQAGFGQIEARS